MSKHLIILLLITCISFISYSYIDYTSMQIDKQKIQLEVAKESYFAKWREVQNLELEIAKRDKKILKIDSALSTITKNKNEKINVVSKLYGDSLSRAVTELLYKIN